MVGSDEVILMVDSDENTIIVEVGVRSRILHDLL
jgi:hypothetical protein